MRRPVRNLEARAASNSAAPAASPPALSMGPPEKPRSHRGCARENEGPGAARPCRLGSRLELRGPEPLSKAAHQGELTVYEGSQAREDSHRPAGGARIFHGEHPGEGRPVDGEQKQRDAQAHEAPQRQATLGIETLPWKK